MLSLVKEYLDLPEDSPERRALERKFGAGIIARHVREYEEERSTKAWLENSTTECPGCRVYVEKSLGCNHVRTFYFDGCEGRLIKTIDDVREMPTAFLLSLRYKAESTSAI